MKTLLIALPILVLGGIVGCTETTRSNDRENQASSPEVNADPAEVKTIASNEVGDLQDEFDTSSAAAYALTSDPDFILAEKDGWKIFNHRDGKTRWSFVPVSHPAYPAAARQVLVVVDGQPVIDGGMLCEAADSACWKWNAELPALNAAMLKELMEGSPTAPPEAPQQ